MTRRQFAELAALYIGAALMGAVGGLTAQEDGEWGDEEDEPPG